MKGKRGEVRGRLQRLWVGELGSDGGGECTSVNSESASFIPCFSHMFI